MNYFHSSISALELNRVIKCDSHLIARYSNLAQKLIQQSKLFSNEISYSLSKTYSFNRVHLYSTCDLLLFFSCNNVDIAFVHACAPQYGVGTILWLLVDKNYQRHNLGSLLLEHCTSFYRDNGAHKIRLTSPTLNNNLFYLKSGFRAEGILENHWHNLTFYNYGLSLVDNDSNLQPPE